ncbi:MAG: hypothetical protein J6Y07_02350 [Alphaproteobacteria bacterium]|nr:hypothetical protein [Alphaproteobacteria bacterium]
MQNIMIPDKYKDIFETLGATHNTTQEYKILSIWPNEIPMEKLNVTCHEFWPMNEVLGTVKNLDTEIYQSSATIEQILRKYAPNTMSPANKFKLFDNHVNIVRINEDSLTANLSRYGMWAIMKEVGNQNDTIFQTEYLLSPQPNLMNIFARTRHISRIATREKVANSNTHINGILGSLTKQKYYFADFHSKLSGWLFANTNITKIQQYYHIPENKPLADYMNDTLITVFANALENTVTQYNRLPQRQKNYENLCKIAKKEMLAARQYFTNNDDDPALNMCNTSVADVQKDREHREQVFINKYIGAYVKQDLSR